MKHDEWIIKLFNNWGHLRQMSLYEAMCISHSEAKYYLKFSTSLVRAKPDKIIIIAAMMKF